MLCQYRDALGEPGKGVHAVRVGGIAVVDLLLTLLLGAALTHVYGWRVEFTWLGLLVLGVLVHRLFCVNSTVNQWIFGKV
jgi:hypothetical protein